MGLFDWLGLTQQAKRAKRLQKRRKQLEALSPLGDSYLDACFAVEDAEREEDRGEVAELGQLIALEGDGPWSGRQAEKGMTIINAASEKYPDYDLLIIWRARVLLAKTSRAEEARMELLRGLKTARRKYLLLQELGKLALGNGEVREGVMWMIKSICSQTTIAKASARDHCPYLYLAHIARASGDLEASEFLLKEVDDIWWGIRLLESEERKLFEKFGQGGGRAIHEAIQHLCQQVLS